MEEQQQNNPVAQPNTEVPQANAIQPEAPVEQPPLEPQKKSKLWIWIILVLIIILLGVGGWWFISQKASNVDIDDKISEIVDVDSVVDGEAMDGYKSIDTRDIEENNNNERLNEFSFLYPQEFELNKLHGDTAYFNGNYRLDLYVASSKLVDDMSLDDMGFHGMTLDNGRYILKEHDDLLLYREDFTLAKSFIGTDNGDRRNYYSMVIKDGYLIRINYVDILEVGEEAVVKILDTIIDSVQNYGEVGYTGDEQNTPEGYKLFDSRYQLFKYLQQDLILFDVSFNYPASFDAIEYDADFDIEMGQTTPPMQYLVIKFIDDNEENRESWWDQFSTSCDDYPEPENECQLSTLGGFSLKKYKRIGRDSDDYMLYAQLDNKLIALRFTIYPPYEESVPIEVLENVINTMQLTQRQIDLEDEQTIKSMTDYLGAIGYWVHKMCPDQGEDINTAQPISGNVICAEATWPELIEDYVWGDDAVIDSDDLDFCVHSDTLPDIRCNISGCRPEDCVTSQEYSDSEQQEPDNSIFTENHTSLAQLAPTMIICLDDGNAISQPVTGGLVCNSMETTWPELTGGYLWSQAFDSSNVNGNMIWNFCAYHATLDDIECDNTGCHQEDCEESLIDTDNDGITDKNEINIYQTDPNNPDTDGDSYNDGEEVNNGYNPLGEGLLE